MHLSQFQGPYQEFLGGTAVVYHLSKQRGKELSVNIGTNYRYASESDAVIPTIGAQYLTWYFEFSYDINAPRQEVTHPSHRL